MDYKKELKQVVDPLKETEASIGISGPCLVLGLFIIALAFRK